MPRRDNFGDKGLQTFKQVLLNKLQLNITEFTNYRPKMAAFSLKTFRLFNHHFNQSSFRLVMFSTINLEIFPMVPNDNCWKMCCPTLLQKLLNTIKRYFAALILEKVIYLYQLVKTKRFDCMIRLVMLSNTNDLYEPEMLVGVFWMQLYLQMATILSIVPGVIAVSGHSYYNFFSLYLIIPIVIFNFKTYSNFYFIFKFSSSSQSF